MFRVACTGAFVAVLAAQGVALANNPTADALRQQVRALREEEKVVLKVIRARYDTVVRAGKLNERELAAERRALDAQERQYLAVTSSSAERENIREHYRVLRHALNNGSQIDAALIARLREQEHVHVKLVAAMYKAKIAELDAAIRVASQSGTTRKR